MRTTRRPTSARRCANAARYGRHRRTPRPSRRRSSGRASASGANMIAREGCTADPAPARRPNAAHPANRGGDTSDVPGQSDAAEDLPANRVVPVAEARPQDVGGHRPGTTAQHLVVPVEEGLAVEVVDHRGETGPW